MAQFFQVIWSEHRKHLVPPKHYVYPATPAGYYTGYYPGSKAVETNRVGFKITLQQVQELNVYPVTPVITPYPSYLAPLTHKIGFKRLEQRTLELNTYPQTPVIVPLTAYLTPLSFSIKFKRAHQRVAELNVYPATPPTTEPITAYQLPQSFRTKFTRKLQTVEHNIYPETPGGYYSGYYPGSILAKSYRIGFTVNRQKLLELNVYPSIVTPAPISAWLTHFEKTQNSTNRKQLTLQELNIYPAPIPSLANIGAWITHFEPTRNRTNRQLASLNFNIELAAVFPTIGHIDGELTYVLGEDYGSVILYPHGVNYFTFEEKLIYNAAAQDGMPGSFFIGNGGRKSEHISGNDAYYNTGVGLDCLLNNVRGAYNCAFGYDCLEANIDGISNFAQGAFTLTDNINGDYNTGTGNAALNRNIDGNHNLGLGSFAGFHNLHGDYNTFIGNYTGAGVYLSSDIIGNTAAGYKAGFNLQTGADYNLLLGYQAGDAISTGSYNIVLGYDIDVISPTGDYQITIGDIIKGEYGGTKKLGFFGTAPIARQAGYTTFGNLSTDRTADADATSVAELADILGTLIEDLKALGLIED